MKYQNFIMRILCLLLILAAVVGYNSMQKKDTQAQESQEITALTKRVEKLEEQNTEILSALEEAAKNQEAAIAQAQRDAKDKDDAAKEDAEGADAADTEESDDSENVYKDGTYTGSAQGFGGAITVQVTLANDEITDIQVTSAPGEDSAYLSQGEGVISSIISAQSTDVETVVLLSHKKPDGHINVKVEFGEGEGKVPLDNIAKRAESYKPKERVTYKMIKEYIEAKYGFKVHTAYIAEVKRDLGLPMYDAPNAVEELKQPRKHPTVEKVEAIKDALKHFEVI